ncbi:hypothetical protein GGR51DRAFT_577825 [Nemania sp. FL0031]|nr:hypothetical protein GGR51DRAFT_577825 [Nemania sp. FL0031]
MSLLHRWSFPSRGFIRNKSEDETSSGQSKFPTIHIGQPVLPRRADLSSAFLTLFEKPENRQRVRNIERSSEAADDLPLLVPRRENAPPDTNFQHSNTHEYQATTSPQGNPLPKGSQLEFISENTTAGGMKPSAYLTPGNQIDETPKIRSFSLSSTNTSGKGSRDDAIALQSTMATDGSERIRSASSSYPSEGIRSPATSCRSPEPVASRTMKYLAEYRCYGRYPSDSMCDLANMPISEECSNGAVRGNIQAANVADDTPSSSATSSPNPFPSSPHILGNEDAISSQREAKFRNSQSPNVRDPFDDGHSYQIEGRHNASTDRLRLSGDTDRTMLTAVRQSSVEDEEGSWSTIRDVGEKRLSRVASWLQLFAFPTSNHSSSITLTQRIQKLRLRNWVKRACFKTKARFRLVGKRVSAAKGAGSRIRRGKWRHTKGRKPTTKKPKKNTGQGKDMGWSVVKTLDATKVRARQHKKAAGEIFGPLAKRKSLQFGWLRSEKESKDLMTHKRVQSCPASIYS